MSSYLQAEAREEKSNLLERFTAFKKIPEDRSRWQKAREKSLSSVRLHPRLGKQVRVIATTGKTGVGWWH